MLRLRRYKSPDGHDWRDPEMPVVRFMQDTQQMEDFLKEEVQAVHQHQLIHNEGEPWHNDPTYNLRRKNVCTFPR